MYLDRELLTEKKKKEVIEQAVEYLSAAGPLTPEELSRLLCIDPVVMVRILNSAESIKRRSKGKTVLYCLRGHEAYARERLSRRDSRHRPLVFGRMNRWIVSEGRKSSSFSVLIKELEEITEGVKELRDTDGPYDRYIDAIALSPKGGLYYQFKNVGRVIKREDVEKFVEGVKEFANLAKIVKRYFQIGNIWKIKYYTSSVFANNTRELVEKVGRDRAVSIELIDGVEILRRLRTAGLLDRLRRYLEQGQE